MNEARKLLKDQLRIFYDSHQIIIGQAIDVERNLKLLAKNKGVSDQEFLDSLRYFIQKGYLKGYTRPDDLETVALTAEGADLLMPDVQKNLSITSVNLRKAILEILAKTNKANKFNLIGKGGLGKGNLELHYDTTFTEDERALAGKVFEDLKKDGYIQATYTDLIDPENWVVITTRGKEFLQRDLKDKIDLTLEQIAPHLIELRKGMWDALERNSPDAGRQAVHSARELIDQTLKEGTPKELTTRKSRASYIMQQRSTGSVSSSDLEVVVASCELIEAEHNKMQKLAHGRISAPRDEVRGSVEAAERVLRLLFGSD